MNIILWIFIILLFLFSIIGVIIPFIPDTIPLWGGILLGFLLEPAPVLPTSFWIGMILLSLFILVSDYITSVFVVKKYGGSRLAILGSVAGLLIGPFIFGPPGIILGPLIVVFVIGLLEDKGSWQLSSKRALAVVAGIFSSYFIKICLQLVMIFWFISLNI
ncbi:MAG: DUF456 domain-containing protein [bacterium]